MAAVEPVAQIERLLADLEALPDPVARATATEVVEALVRLYGEGLARVVEIVAARDDGTLAEALGGDELVAHLLLLHGLHPVPVEDRVRGALRDVLPYLESHGGSVELVAVDEGVVHLRLQGSCSGCPSSAMTLKLAIEDAILKAAPDVEEVRADGLAPPPGPAPAIAPATWATADGPSQLVRGGVLLQDVSGEPVLFLRPGERVYAYRPDCPACGASLRAATLRATELTCPGCAHRFDVLRAGRCLDAPQLHLEPVPLLADDTGRIRIALGAPA
jgi:Fe-S cluster biogenesis protein NfuA/nitrite reductase/ring-hydroxylating ferredoxin subunit